MPRTSAISRLRSTSILLAATLTFTLGSLVAPSAQAATVPVPPTPTGLPAAVEGLSPYVPASGCEARTRPGALKLAELLKTTYGATYGLSRSCAGVTSPSSEHYDGRAVDTFFNVRNAAERAEATTLISWLLATDAAGNRYANARRLGIMYIIWNDKMWSSYRSSEGWRPYSTCATTTSTSYDTACHRNHIHLSLSWEGAMGRTSYWTNSVAPVDYGPCRPADLNWAAGYSTPRPIPCPRYATVTAPSGASTQLKSLVTRSGMQLRSGMSGSAVTVLQQAIGVSPATGYFGTTTTARLKAWQSAHALDANGVTWHSTWRALLSANGMRWS